VRAAAALLTAVADAADTLVAAPPPPSAPAASAAAGPPGRLAASRSVGQPAPPQPAASLTSFNSGGVPGRAGWAAGHDGGLAALPQSLAMGVGLGGGGGGGSAGGPGGAGGGPPEGGQAAWAQLAGKRKDACARDDPWLMMMTNPG
jgi:hypothetical protein